MLKESEILQFIMEDKTSTKKQLASIGKKYYHAEHDIMSYRMFYFNADGKLVEDTTRSNIRTSSYSLADMFSRTGGSFTGTPSINTTYYTSNTVV